MLNFINSMIPWLPLIGPILAAVVAILGLGVAHWLTSQREFNAEKRKTRVSFMIEAYRRLEVGSCRGKNQEQYAEQFHSALADIQLLGSPQQVAIAMRIASMLGRGTGESVTINELLVALRTELRMELNLKDVGDQLVIIRSPDELRAIGGDHSVR